MSIAWMQRLREAGLTQAQAEAIASLPEDRYVTRDYFDAHLDARISQLEASLTWRLIGIITIAIILVGLVRP